MEEFELAAAIEESKVHKCPFKVAASQTELTVDSLQEEKQDLQRQVLLLKAQNRRQRFELKKYKAKQKVFMSRKHRQRVIKEELSQFLTPGQVSFFLGKKQKRVKWSEDDIVTGLLIKAISTKAYETLRQQKICPLPSPATLRVWTKNFKCKPGVQEHVVHMLKKLLESEADPKFKYLTICFDEMHIKSDAEYHKGHDAIYGPASQLQVCSFLVVSLT